jgi:beta-lactamase regulating signal transducer with metallopeptidase domain
MEIFLKGLIVIGIAFLMNLIFRSKSASFRHFIWLSALIALLIIPFAAIVLPRIQMPLYDLSPWIQNGLEIEDASMGFDAGISVSRNTQNIIQMHSILEYLYLIGIFITLSWLLRGFFLSFRIRLKAVPIQEKEIDSLFEKLKACLGIRPGVPLMSTRSVGTPATLGIFKPSVYIPEQAIHWPRERLKLVLLHELAHVIRKDAASRFIGGIACSVYWFNPLVWLIVQNMLREQEYACDGFAVRNGIKPSFFASNLIVLAGKHIRGCRSYLVTLVKSDDLKSRLFELLLPSRNNSSLKVSQIIVVGFSTVILLFGLSTMSFFSTVLTASEANLLAGARMYFYGQVRIAHQEVLDCHEIGDYFNGIHGLLFSEDEFTKEEIEAHLEKLRAYIYSENLRYKSDVQESARSKIFLIVEKTRQLHEKYLPFKGRISINSQVSTRD